LLLLNERRAEGDGWVSSRSWLMQHARHLLASRSHSHAE